MDLPLLTEKFGPNWVPKEIFIKFPRFGTALQRLRAQHQGDVKRVAKHLLKTSARGHKGMSKRRSSWSMWVKSANLEPVFEYLSS